MHMQRRYHQLRQATPPIPVCHEQHISVLGPEDAIDKLDELVTQSPDMLIDSGVSGLRPEPPEKSPLVYAYVNGQWRAEAARSEATPKLSLQIYAYDLQNDTTAPNVADKLKQHLKKSEDPLLRAITTCVDPVLDSPFDAGDAPFDAGDAPFDAGDAPFDAGDAPFDAGDAPFDAGDAPFDAGDAPSVVNPEITENTVAGQAAMERTGVNWLKQARPDLTGRDVTVLILDTLPTQEGIDVAHEYVDFWVDWVEDQGEPAVPPDVLPPRPIIPAADIHKYHGVLVASLVRHLAPASTIIAARVLDERGKGWSTTVIRAILWALSHRNNKTMVNGRRLVHDKLILNMSMGLPRTQAEEAEAVCLLRTLHVAARAGTLAVAASGNDSLYKPENPVEPAAYGFFGDTRPTASQVIAAAGTNRLTEYAFFSNEGHIAAPCRHIIGDTGSDSHIQQKHGFSTVRWSGTSFATPQISGLAALLLSTGRVPFYEIKQHIWRTCHIPRHWKGVREIDFMRAFRAI